MSVASVRCGACRKDVRVSVDARTSEVGVQRVLKAALEAHLDRVHG